MPKPGEELKNVLTEIKLATHGLGKWAANELGKVLGIKGKDFKFGAQQT